jgi:hypothetical protein
MYGSVYSYFMNYARREGFASSGDSAGASVLALIMIALLIVVQLFIVRWLWNTVFVRVVSFARPIPSLLYTFGFLLLIAMVHPGVAMA